MSSPDIPALPRSLPPIPVDAEGPVFREPWEAQIFALVVRLHQQKLFTWLEWAETLTAEIREAQAQGDADLGDSYYRHWLNALEHLLDEKGIALHPQQAQRQQDIAAQPTGRHEHVARREPIKVC